MEEQERASLADSFIEWVLNRSIEGCTIKRTKEGALIESERATGNVNLYDLNGQTVVELRLVVPSNGETLFFLHFELEDLKRAKVLFLEMEDTLDRLIHRKVRHVLLCCTCGITTTFFANKLNETAKSLGLDYDFCAKPLEEARKVGSDFAAVLLAPQVGYHREAMERELPNTVVIELPGRIFGSYDASGALRLVVEAITEHEAKSNEGGADGTLKAGRDLSSKLRILTVCHVMREERESTISYRIFDHGKTPLSGQISRPKLTASAIITLLEGLVESGWKSTDFDAIGISFSKRVNDGVVDFDDEEDAEYQGVDLQKYLSELWGTSVFVHNTGLAAAACCYITQSSHESIAFHAQPLGDPNPTLGFVINGKPFAGKAGMAGQLGFAARGLNLNMSLEHAAWRYEGIRQLVLRYITAIACTVAPEAIYVWCDLMPDTEDLTAELTKVLPEGAVPELIAVSNYEEYVHVGEMSLCLDGLREQGLAE